MTSTQTTSLPLDTPKFHKNVAKIIHLGMYILLAGVAISGLTIGCIYWLGLKDTFIIQILISLHELIVNLLYWLIGIHVLAATYHRLKKDGVWSYMVPFFKE